MTQLGRILRTIRIERNELLYDMAQKLGVSSAFLSSVETGKKAVPLDWPAKLTKLYNLDSQKTYEIVNAANEATKQIRLAISNTNHGKRDLALSFARRFESMTEEEVEAIRSIFLKYDKGGLIKDV